LAQESKSTRKDFGVVNASHANSYYGVSCNVKLENGVKDKKGDERSAIVCTGTVGVYLDIDPWPFAHYKENRTQDFTLNIFMWAGPDGEIKTYQETHVAKQATHSTLSKTEKKAVSITSFVADLLSSGGNQALLEMEELESSLATNDSLRGLSGSQGLGVDLKNLQNRLILPAPSTFAYKDLSFSDDNDLLLYVSYVTSSS
jgi:hypothetical protein